MKMPGYLTLCLLFAATNSFAVSAARVEGDLKVGGVLYLSDNSALSTSNGFLKDRGTWVSGGTYSAGDIVQNDGSSYVCKTANQDNTLTNALHWSILAANGVTPTVTPEPAGSNCAFGGVKVQVGTATAQYVCNGSTTPIIDYSGTYSGTQTEHVIYAGATSPGTFPQLVTSTSTITQNGQSVTFTNSQGFSGTLSGTMNGNISTYSIIFTQMAPGCTSATGFGMGFFKDNKNINFYTGIATCNGIQGYFTGSNILTKQ